MDTLRTWLGRYGWAVIVAATLLLGTWSLVDEQTVKWVSTGLLLLGLIMLTTRAFLSASASSRQ